MKLFETNDYVVCDYEYSFTDKSEILSVSRNEGISFIEENKGNLRNTKILSFISLTKKS
jgi:hypothetical protein